MNKTLSSCLEKSVDGHSSISVEENRLLQLKRERQICRIRLRSTDANQKFLGTGFLIGPRAILTNWHLIVGMKHNLSSIEVVFDFKFEDDGLSIVEPAVVKLADEPIYEVDPENRARS